MSLKTNANGTTKLHSRKRDKAKEAASKVKESASNTYEQVRVNVLENGIVVGVSLPVPFVNVYVPLGTYRPRLPKLRRKEQEKPQAFYSNRR
jgi:hypothetical protein